MPAYFEFAPPARLADRVECFWVSNYETHLETAHRVTPDGCADILYTRGGRLSTLLFVGSMTCFQDFQHMPGGASVGMRFRPAMWTDIARVDGASVADLLLPLDDLWGGRAAELRRLLDYAADHPVEIARLLAQAVRSPVARSPFQHAVGALERSQGALTLDRAANLAGLGARQFRRRCLETVGLSPKLLSRILRFRRASGLVSQMSGHFADLAAECGYADQSHMIAEFQRFAGRTPRRLSS